MMTGDTSGLVPHIKKEVEQNTFQACSPSNSDMYSPTTTVLPQDVSTPLHLLNLLSEPSREGHLKVKTCRTGAMSNVPPTLAQFPNS